MDEQQKQEYRSRYQEEKSHGVPFFPDILFKDAVLSLLVFLILIALALFVGAPLEARANPADTSYTPRPEWYFLFLFQLLKYFPGNLEVVGVFVLPTLGLALLFLLPFLDRSPRRYPWARPVVSGATLLAVAGVLGLTALARAEAPPPLEEKTGDPTAALYAANCSACHGAAIQVPTGTNLHQTIAQGRHEGMPAWSSDLSSDQIDALAGFILSPAGSSLFTEECGACHEAPSLVAGDPLELRGALAQGADFPAHAGLDVPNWAVTLQPVERTALLNFLAAPDGQRLFATNCSPCHGQSVGFNGDPEALKDIIRQGGLHLEMPPWRERLTDGQINTLASYVADPGTASEGSILFGQHCATCHAQRVPVASSVDQARDIIRQGGPHETMPVWGDILTEEQLDALTSYTLTAAEGTPLQLGGELFAKNCSPCHGDFGEGGPNPTLAQDIIAPISSAEFLKTRDDTTLRAIISQGQPTIGMSPFGTSYGGPLDDDQIDAIVTFLRAWESAPPVEVPPQVAATPVATSGAETFAEVCSQCHGPNGQGGLGPSLLDSDFQARMTDQELSEVISLGHEATPMIGWGEILSSQQIDQVVAYIRELGGLAAGPTPTIASGPPSFAQDVFPILQARCGACHGSMGGWDASTFDSVISSGNNGPAVVPGDAEGSLLAQKIMGTQTQGSAMPLVGSISEQEVQRILDWIASGAPNN